MGLLGAQALVDIQGISGILALLSLGSLAPSVPINPIPLIHQAMRTITLYIVLLWLSVAPLSAQGRRWNVELSFKKAAITGLCIIDTVEQQPRGAILNEFGIKMVDFVCMPNGKVKLYNLVPMLNKWYIRHVLRHDLQQIVPQLVTRDSLTYENPKRHITYRFKPLKPTEDETER